MTRVGQRERRRVRAGGPSVVKRGPASWVYGTKLEFFLEHKDEFIAASETKKTKDFYDGMTRLFTAKYGWSLPWNEDLPEDVEVADDVVLDEDIDALPLEVTEARADFVKKLRTKIAAWYNAQFGQSTRKKTTKTSFKELFNKTALEPPAPVKPRVLHYYSRRFYEERIKSRFTARWAAVSKLDKPPAAVSLRNAVTKLAWLSETPEFKAEVVAAMENEHKAALEAYKAVSSGDTPQTAEEYSVVLNNAGYYLQPFADAARERFGMNVSIFLCGPVPEHGGRIEVRSVHAGQTNSLVPKVWSEYDRAGFDAAQRSMVEFTRRCYTEAECQARRLSATQTEGQASGEGDAGAANLPSDSTSVQTSAPDSSLVSNAATGTSPPVRSQAGNTAMPRDVETPLLDELFRLDDDLLDLDRGFAQNGGNNPMRAPNDPMNMSPEQLEMMDDAFANMSPEDARMLEQLANLTPDEFAALTGSAPQPERCAEIGRALAAELAAVPIEERETYLEKLKEMTAVEVDEENALAEERRVLRRLSMGMSMQEAAAASDVGDDDGDDEARVGSGTARMPSPSPEGWLLPSPPAAGRPPPPPPLPAGQPPPLPLPPPATLPPLPPPPPAQTPPPRPPRVETPSPPSAPPSAARPRPRPAYKAAAESWGSVDAAWPTELARAFHAFARGKDWGGRLWKTCADGIVELERAWGFREKGLISMPTGDARPEEVAVWMKNARKWDATMQLKGEVGPRDVEETFANQWWGWWGLAQPEGRISEEDGEWKRVEELEPAAWDELSKMHGRNGLLMYAAGLLWWGEAAAASENAETLLAEWRDAVEDLTNVLEATVKRVPSVKRAVEESNKKSVVPAKQGVAPSTKRGGEKRKSESNKENDQRGDAAKKRRTSE